VKGGEIRVVSSVRRFAGGEKTGTLGLLLGKRVQ